MHRGYIKLHRKILDWEWYEDGNTFRLLIHLILNANHSEQKWKGNIIKKGQLITSLPVLSKKLKITIQQVRTSLKKLISTGEITDKTTNKFRIITVNNYESYQESNRQNNNQITDNQQTSNSQVTANNNDKEYKKMKKNEKEIKKEKTQLEIALNDFIKHRKNLKKPLTEKGLQLIVNKLNKLSINELEQIEIINQSIENGWQGIFELKNKSIGQQNQKKGMTDEDYEDIIRNYDLTKGRSIDNIFKNEQNNISFANAQRGLM